MPNLDKASLIGQPKLQRMEAHAPSVTPMPPPQEPWNQPSPILRCPLPQAVASADNMRQFYRNGLPQHRVIPPKTLAD